MTNEEIEQLVSNLSKKMDKTLNLLTKIAKTLHLLPVTEAEERNIQIFQRKNLATAAKINDELNAMENKVDSGTDHLTLGAIIDMLAPEDSVYNEIVGQEFLGGD